VIDMDATAARPPPGSVRGESLAAVLGATVIAAVATLLKPRPMLELGSLKTAPAVIGWGTFVATLALAPRVELGVLVGIGLHGLFVGVRRLRRDP